MLAADFEVGEPFIKLKTSHQEPLLWRWGSLRKRLPEGARTSRNTPGHDSDTTRRYSNGSHWPKRTSATTVQKIVILKLQHTTNRSSGPSRCVLPPPQVDKVRSTFGVESSGDLP